MLLEKDGMVEWRESDILDRWGLPTYTVSIGTHVKVFNNGENAYMDSSRYYWDAVMTLIYG